MLDEFLKNELSFDRESGTYLFYGDDVERNFELALEFAKHLLSKNIKDLKNIESIKQKVDRQTYSDLYVIDNLNIDIARDMIKKSYSSSHEGNAKVFILKNIQDIRKESANAILKIIEEPTRDNFFILLSKHLNILTTIRSRSIIYRVKRATAEELGVDKYSYEFFLASSTDIKKFKQSSINLSEEVSFKSIGKFIKAYEIEEKIEEKVNIYKALRDFVIKSENLKLYEKIKFAEDINNNITNRENVKLVVDYLINLVKRNKNLKGKLYLKKMLRYPINLKLFFINLILEI